MIENMHHGGSERALGGHPPWRLLAPLWPSSRKLCY